MATSALEHERQERAERPNYVVRYRRPARLLHTATYLLTLALLGTGWWLRLGQEGQPSVLARIVNWSDVTIHRRAGWALVVLFGLAVTIGIRGAFTFARETVRVERGEIVWFRRWLRGAFTGRFARHDGHFDPGQRIANIAFVVTFGVLVVTGIGLTTLHGGPEFATLDRLHRGATYVLTALVVAHVFLAVGILPGYRGAWRSMHLRGRTPVATARRLWPHTVEARGVTTHPRVGEEPRDLG
jgi:cytochrome b subunit of formate dehydrogenase